jgi:predicted ATP-grasp superfamily ATP-dependent carboligase
LIAYYLAVLREEFPPEVRRSITPLDEIERCLIKTRFSVACQMAGQLVPSQAAPDDVMRAVEDARTLGYPIIVKPKSHLVVGAKERGRLVRNEGELLQHYRRYEIARGQEQIAANYPELAWPLLQRYIPTARACVYSVSGIRDAERGTLAATVTCKRQQWPPDIGISTVQSLCQDDRILDAGLSTVQKLLSRGIFELELVAEGDELLAIDLNPRAFGFIALDIAAGNDLPWLWWQTTTNAFEASGESCHTSELECRFVVPYYFGQTIKRIFAPSIQSERSAAKTAATPWISMLGHRTDPLPMLLANVELLRLLPHRGGLLRPFLGEAWRARGEARKQASV